MLNSFINNIPLVKEVLNVIFNKSLGFNLDLEQITVDKGIGLNFKDIDLNPYMLNQLIFAGNNKSIKLRIAKISIHSFSIALSANEYCVHADGLKVVIMPISLENNNIQLNKETPLNNSNKGTSTKSQQSTGEGIVDSIINYFLSKIEVRLENIAVHILNYETTQENIAYANPCLSMSIAKAYYTKGICDNEKDSRNFYDNKMISVSDVRVMIEKNYREKKKNDEDDYENDNGKDYGIDNSVIMTIEQNKGIKVYSNYNNEFSIELGIIQVIITPLQLELLRNIIYAYMELFTIDTNNTTKEIESNEKATPVTVNNKSSILTKIKLKFSCAGISMVLYENSYRSDLPKYYLYDTSKPKLINHFCYFEDNYYLLSIVNITCSIDNNIINGIIEDTQLVFIEYDTKTSKTFAPEIETIDNYDNKSQYEDAEYSSTIFKNNECYHSVYSSQHFNQHTQVFNYDFKYSSYDIAVINSIKPTLDKNIDMSIDSIIINIHPIYLFKGLKAIYSNLILLNEILFYNYDIKEKEIKVNGNEFNGQQYDIIDNLNIEENIIRPVKKMDKIDTIPVKAVELNMTFKINEIIVNLHCFKRENDFETIATPYFAEFYYDSIYLINKKYNSKRCLDISLITSKNILSFTFKGLSMSYNDPSTNVNISSFNCAFNNKLLIDSSQQSQVGFSQREPIKETEGFLLTIDLSFNCTLPIWLLKEMITFLEVWNVTMTMFQIFQSQMEMNHIKIREDINSMYSISHRNSPINDQTISTPSTSPPMLIIINLQSISLNIKSYYDTDNLIISFNDIKSNLFLSNNYQNINFDLTLAEIKSKRLFSSTKISFDFNMESSTNANGNDNNNILNKKTFPKKNEYIYPDRDFEEFIIKSKSLKHVKESASSMKVTKRIMFKFIIETIGIQSMNFIKLVPAILPQLSNNTNGNNDGIKGNYNQKPIGNDENDIDNFINQNSSLSSSNLMNYSPNKTKTLLDFIIEVNDVSIDYTKNSTSLLVSFDNIKLSPSSFMLKEWKIVLQRELCHNYKKSLSCTCASICDISLLKTPNDDIEFSIGRIDIRFCKDSFWGLIDIINDLIESIMLDVKDIMDIVNTDNNQNDSTSASPHKSNTNTLNNSSLSGNSNFNPPLIILDIVDEYLPSVQSSKYYEQAADDEYINQDKKIKKMNQISISLGDIYIALFKGEDFVSEIDYKATKLDVIIPDDNGDDETDNFIRVESSQFAIKSRRDLDNYVMVSLRHFELKTQADIEALSSSTIDLIIDNIEILDNINTSTFQRIMSRKDVEEAEPILKASIQIDNSLNSLSASCYCDYEIVTQCSIKPIAICIDQITLLFILSFFTLDQSLISSSIKETSSPKKEENKVKEGIGEPIIIQAPPQEMKNSFVHLTHHSNTKKEQFIFIKQFILNEIDIDISFQEHTLSTSSNNISIPILSLEQFAFHVNEIKLKGYSLPNDLISILTTNLLSQIMTSKFKLLYQGIRAFTLTKPITCFVEKFVQIFTTPYYSYKENKGLFNGLLKGVKNFIMNIVSLNFLYGEKTIKTLTTFIGVSKSNQITKKSFYNSYCIDEDQQKFNKYFYK